MPHTYARTFRIRSYECDAYGHLYNANYLRLMQETATDASSDAGYDPLRYQEMKRAWFIRTTDIEYLLPVMNNDQIEIRTWVADIRRASSRRKYEFYRLKSAELVARAYTDWVFLDTTSDRPTSIPAELARAFFPEGLPASFPERVPFPEAPLPPSGTFRISRRVAWQDIDLLGHVNNAVYLDYVTECGMQVVKAHHWPVTRMLADGFGILLRRNQIQYLQPAFLDDELEISTWFSKVRFSTATRYYEITRPNDQAKIAFVQALGVWVDLKTGQPIRIPKQMIADFSPNRSED